MKKIAYFGTNAKNTGVNQKKVKKIAYFGANAKNTGVNQKKREKKSCAYGANGKKRELELKYI